jgi:hypothetical protein
VIGYIPLAAYETRFAVVVDIVAGAGTQMSDLSVRPDDPKIGCIRNSVRSGVREVCKGAIDILGMETLSPNLRRDFAVYMFSLVEGVHLFVPDDLVPRDIMLPNTHAGRIESEFKASQQVSVGFSRLNQRYLAPQ